MRERHRDYAALVDYVVRRWAESEADARLTAARLEHNLGMDKEKLLRAAKAQREARP